MTARERLRELALSATPGPWRFYDGCITSDRGVVARSPRITDQCAPGSLADADFIASASPSVVLGLLVELERAESRIAELEAQRDAAALDRDAAVQAMPHDEEIAEFRSVIRYVGKSGAHDEVCDSADALTKWIDVAEATKRCLESRAALRSHAKGVDRV